VVAALEPHERTPSRRSVRAHAAMNVVAPLKVFGINFYDKTSLCGVEQGGRRLNPPLKVFVDIASSAI
jgi:hypothetical protein